MSKAGCNIRFHGTTGRYSGNYTDKMLADWANWLKKQTKNAHAIYAYFNNDAHAINNAKTLKEQFCSLQGKKRDTNCK
ncbi:DUF72 domain-containing protein [Candidatus Bathyarchaeota archaeon]|nr:DUF72 domain-containing protein [Candidatus Bathyarchaeota archaeon]